MLSRFQEDTTMTASAVARRGSIIALALVLAACGSTGAPPPPASTAKPAPAPVVQPDLKAVAASLVKAGMIKPGDKVLISGSARDAALLEDVAIETMKAGGQPLITLTSEQLARRSYDEVPTSFDSQPQTLGVALVNLFDAQIVVDVGEADSTLQGVPAARIAARGKTGQAVTAAAIKRGPRVVNLGNGLYPTLTLAQRLGKSQSELAEIFWKATTVAPETIRARGEAVRADLAHAKQITIASANGTNITFAVMGSKGVLSDGGLTPEKVKAGGSAATTWLPAGELILPVANGTADGKIVIDRSLVNGAPIEGLTLTFAKGKLVSMTATTGIEALKALYDASGGAKDQFASIDIGLNPAVNLPTSTGRIVWMVPGNITVSFGENASIGGANVTDFSFYGALTAPTLTADGKTIIANGTLK
jgi:leucyl aminopeptidase (aminopeptidase T)